MLSTGSRLLRRNACRFFHQKRLPEATVCRTLCQSPFHSRSSLSPFHIRKWTPIAISYPRSISSSNVCLAEGISADDEETDWFVDIRKPGSRKSSWDVKRGRFIRHVTNLVRKNKVEEAEEVLNHMLKSSIYPDVVIFNAVIAGYARRKNIKKVFKLYNDMKKRAITPTPRTYTSFFSACTKGDPECTECLEKVREEIDQKDVILNEITYNALISALGACNKPAEAFAMYSKMINMGIEPGIQTFGSLLFAASKDFLTGLERAQRTWSEMLASGLTPDLHCYNLLLLCFRDCATRVPDSMKVIVAANSSGKKVTDTGYDGSSWSTSHKAKGTETNVLIPFYLDLTQNRKLSLRLATNDRRYLDNVTDLMDIFEEEKKKPDIKTFHLLASLVLDYDYIADEMDKRGIAPDSKLMIASIRTQAQYGNIAQAKAIMKEAGKRGLDLEQMGYQALASGCTSQYEGLQLLKEMKAAGVRPNVYVLGTLLGNAAHSRKYEYLTAVLKEMKEVEVLPNNVIVNILESAAKDTPKNTRLMSRYNGFKGYYELWKRTMTVD